MEIYGTGRQTTDNNITWRMRFECCITKATDIHSEYVILIAFPTTKMVTRTYLITFIRTLSVWLGRISEFKECIV